MTIRQQIEQQLKEVTQTPDQSEIKNTLIEAMRWSDANKTLYPPDTDWHLTYENGVKYALKWVLGLTDENPIEEEYQEQ